MNIKTMDPAEEARPRVRRWPWLLLSLTGLLAVLALLMMEEDTIDVQQAKAAPALPKVSVVTVSASAETVELPAYATVRPRWSAELRAGVSGRVLAVADRAQPGERVAADSLLMRIEASRYQAELAEARQALKEAELALWKARNAHHVAKREFERSKRKAPNSLALKLPQLEIAGTAEGAARARLVAARKRLEETAIIAPFNAFVAERFVSPGQSVSPGDRLLRLTGRGRYDLEVQVGHTEWSLLDHPLEGRKAMVFGSGGGVQARATIRRAGGLLDDQTRQYRLFLEVAGSEAEALMPGDFARLHLPGVTVAAALDIPAAALTQEGHVWLVDDQDRLQRLSPEVLFRRADRVVIRAPGDQATWRIATTPLLSFLPGRQVRVLRVRG